MSGREPIGGNTRTGVENHRHKDRAEDGNQETAQFSSHHGPSYKPGPPSLVPDTTFAAAALECFRIGAQGTCRAGGAGHLSHSRTSGLVVVGVGHGRAQYPARRSRGSCETRRTPDGIDRLEKPARSTDHPTSPGEG